jgi:hypothetical protein
LDSGFERAVWVEENAVDTVPTEVPGPSRSNLQNHLNVRILGTRHSGERPVENHDAKHQGFAA